MQIVCSVARMQKLALKLKKQGKTIAFVPTMGALHRGHLELVNRARKMADITVVSIFVNPTQFAPQEDFSRYPRNLLTDCKLLRPLGVDIVFHPQPQDVYPAGFDTYVVPEKIAAILDGEFRPTHFKGVDTVVLKLFNIVQPNFAIFGRKDLQQSVVIKQMVKDLNVPVRIVVAPTARDADGLALSSRNAYLTVDARRRALAISRSLFAARQLVLSGERNAAKIRNFIRRRLVKDAEADVDYVSVADAETLAELKKISGGIAISLACRIDGVRLIDNILLKVG
jgi:pantoate--beta-alanine ligase